MRAHRSLVGPCAVIAALVLALIIGMQWSYEKEMLSNPNLKSSYYSFKYKNQ